MHFMINETERERERDRVKFFVDNFFQNDGQCAKKKNLSLTYLDNFCKNFIEIAPPKTIFSCFKEFFQVFQTIQYFPFHLDDVQKSKKKNQLNLPPI